jgi:hypothetical protein
MTSPTDRKIDFVVAGAQKGGTTALSLYLHQNPEIYMTPVKEVHFFDNDQFFAHPTINYAIYHAFFQPGPQARVLGESTPIYMYWYDAPKRMWQYNPALKIIVVLRNPVDRAYSHWSMEYSRKTETLPFGEAIRNERARCREALPNQHRVYSYVDRGYYVDQLRRLWTYFPQEQTLIIKNEELRDRPMETMGDVFRFLGVNAPAEIDARTVSINPPIGTISAADRDYLREIYHHDIRNLEHLLGWDCSDWLAD